MKKPTENIEKRNPIIKDDEIDLIEVAKTIWAGRKLIFKITVVFFLIGLVVAFGSKVEYEANCTLMPESQEGMKSNLGGLGSLAGLAGINLDMSTSGVLTPELYPQIAQSTPFLMKVWDEPIYFEKHDTTVSVYEFFKEIEKPSLLSSIGKYTLGLPSLIKNSIFKTEKRDKVEVKKSDIIRLSKEDVSLLESFQTRIIVTVDSKNGIITLTTTMPDPNAAAQLANIGIENLTEYVTNYKISKATENYIFIKERYEEALSAFEKSQIALAAFNDRNRNVVTAIGQAEFQRLQDHYNVRYEVYKGLATQLEQAKIKVKQETPIFTVLEPVLVPIDKLRPKRKFIILMSIAFGIILSTIFIAIKPIIIQLKNKI